MNGSIYQHITLTLAAGEVRNVAISGSYLRVLSNSSATDPFVQIGQQPEQVIKSGIGIKTNNGEPFGLVVFRNPGLIAMTLRFASGDGIIDDSSLVVNQDVPVNGASNDISSPAALTVDDAVAVGAPDISADTTVREVVLQHQAGADVWYGDVNVDPANTRGHKFVAGETRILAVNGDIWLRCAAGLTATVSIVKHKRS
jgi:hypothetical protein